MSLEEWGMLMLYLGNIEGIACSTKEPAMSALFGTVSAAQDLLLKILRRLTEGDEYDEDEQEHV